MNHFEWHNAPQLIEAHDFDALIPIYSDMRISPKGILPIQQRVAELHARTPIPNIEERLTSAQELENYLAQYNSLDLNQITDQMIAEKKAQLINYSVV